jgi:hypothetical protein
VKTARYGIEPRDLPLDKGEIGMRVTRRPLHHRADIRRHVGGQKGCYVERRHIPERDREDDANPDLGEGREDDVQRLLILRHQGVHVLDGGDAVLEAFDRANEGAGADLGAAPLAEIGRLGMQRPDIEGHVLQQAFRQRVVGVEMRVDETRHQQAARGLQQRGGRVGHQPCGGQRVARRHYGVDEGALHQHVPHRRVVNVAGRIPDLGATNDQAAAHAPTLMQWSPRGAGARTSPPWRGRRLSAWRARRCFPARSAPRTSPESGRRDRRSRRDPR